MVASVDAPGSGVGAVRRRPPAHGAGVGAGDGVDRGGPVGCGDGDARATIRAATPGTGFRFPTAESSPIGADARLLRWTSRALLLAGILSIAGAAAILSKAWIGQVLLGVAWQRALAGGVASAPWPGADTRPVARIVAPAQSADVLVLAGATGRTLAWGPGHLDGTAKPGTPGQSVVSAHRDTHFRFLEHAAVGDPIVVERVDGVRVRYRIVSTRIADADHLDIPREVDVPTLTLVTCWPFDAVAPGGPLRYVVVAEEMG